MPEHDMDFVVDAFSSEMDAFSRSIAPEWIHLAVWLILMMGLLRYLSIKDVCHHLYIVIYINKYDLSCCDFFECNCRISLEHSHIQQNMTARDLLMFYKIVLKPLNVV